jgi:hypothetical protein
MLGALNLILERSSRPPQFLKNSAFDGRREIRPVKRRMEGFSRPNVCATCALWCRARPPVYRSTLSSTQMFPDACDTVTTRRSCVREIETAGMSFATVKRGLSNAVTGKG